MCVDLDLPAATRAATGPVDAGDGTDHDGRARGACRSSRSPPYEPLVPGIAEPLDELAELWGALVTATRDYVEKNRFRSVVLGLSGGIDSALVATIACDALGPERVHVVGMPSDWSSGHSVTDAEDLARRQGLQWQLVPIKPMVEAYLASVELTGLSVENLQARVRGTLLMALSNEHGHLVLTTGNKSELATGFSTLYGDSAGGFAPIKDVPKSLVWELARWRNAAAARGGVAVIPPSSIDKPPSRRARARAARQRPAAAVRRARRAAGRLRRAGPRARRAGRAPASTASSSTGSCGWSTPPSTSAGRTRPGRR